MDELGGFLLAALVICGGCAWASWRSRLATERERRAVERICRRIGR